MFLFAHKTKTPTSTYTDSYRVPSSIKQSYEEPPLKAWEENKFVTQGLTQIATKKPVEQRLLEGMTQRAPNQFASQPPIPSSAYLPHKYWISEAEGAGREVQPGLGERGQVRDVEDGTRQQRRLEPLLLSPAAPAQAPGEREAVVNMIDTLSRSQLPSIQVPQHVPGRLPFQGYGSRCTGRHYCLRGMDYFVDGPPPSRRPLGQQTVRSAPPFSLRSKIRCAASTLPPSSFPYANLKWDLSHFKFCGPQRNSFIIHPDFVSEKLPPPVPCCW
ncbi:spermatid-specific manchette-related protein 1 isoform X2 [Ornithorhynchus anatinus]|uniref:spermatid-specific manchette-related protein 1 isoform X2 n=1 Tax=Ornithorhynchus anatinus TaxID=9258 RepID=UPI0019D4D1EB|nr:spermatid-specific manchette-related protein 1 isoform X2 [Ornithorhynchus anatinus]